MLQAVIAFLASFIVALGLLRYSFLHDRFSCDNDLNGIQKFHTAPVPRIGGVAIIIGLLISGLVLPARGVVHSGDYFLMLAVALPAFLAGLFEDVSKNGSVLLRFVAILLSAGLAWWLMHACVTRLDIPWLDRLMLIPAVSLIFTMGAVCGLTNAMNLIDGYNGLASAVSAIMLTGLAYIAFQLGDHLVLSLSMAAIGATLGFLFWNWPRGLIFLGDGGAYLLGFLIAELAVLLVARNPSVSPWFALLLAIYPIFETIFTIVRRTSRRMNPGMPDAAHLHQLVYKRMMRWAVGQHCDPQIKVLRNSLTSPYLWLLSSLGVIPAVLFWNKPWLLQIITLAFCITYVWLYRSIVRFRTPRWLLRK